MKDKVESIFANIDKRCIRNSKLNKNGCTVKLTGISKDKVILDFDCKYLGINSNRSKCDYLVIGGYGKVDYVVPIEMKRRLINSVSHVVKQLQAGALFCESLRGVSTERRFVPVLVSGALSKKERLDLKSDKNRVKYKGKKFPVARMNCGGILMITVTSY